jgi:hypothetical protein
MTKVETMLRDLVQLAEREFGTSADTGAVHRMMIALSQQYGGERVYIEKLPKLVATVRIASIGTGNATSVLASETGLTQRRIRQIVRGR